MFMPFLKKNKPPVVETKRNYKSEAGWEKSKYRQFNIKIERAKGEAFAAALKANGDSMIDWFTRCADEYMREKSSQQP